MDTVNLYVFVSSYIFSYIKKFILFMHPLVKIKTAASFVIILLLENIIICESAVKKVTQYESAIEWTMHINDVCIYRKAYL